MLRHVFREIARLVSGKSRSGAQPAAGGPHANPRPPDASADRIEERYHAALALLKSGDPRRAEAELLAVVEERHDHAGAHYALGTLYEKQGRHDDATDSYLLALCFQPDLAAAQYRLGALAAEAGRRDEALDYFSRATASRPDYAEAYNYMGKLYMETRQTAECQAHFRKAIAVNPAYAPAWSNLAYVVHEQDSNFEEALACAERAVDLDPGLLEAHCNRAMVLQSLGRSEEALRACEDALRLSPLHAESRVNRALALLMLGEFERGWAEYETRRQTYECFRYRPFAYPPWDGGELQGRTLLVYAEQGLGDEIMFASCLPQVLERAGHCVIDCHPKLEKLFRRSFAGATIHGGYQVERDLSWLERVPRVDCQVASGTLPGFLRRRLEDFPRHAGYLRADAQRVVYWRARLAGLGPGLKVGLSWRGGSKYTHRAIRSLDLSELAPLLRVPGAHFVSLQYTDCGPELAAARHEQGVEVHHWQEAIDDYDETAALVSALDLVISVQTAVVHLAGALGRPAWVMVSAAPEWRYQRHGEGMPWYPSVRIVRQGELRRWQPVIERIAQDLRELAGGPGTAPAALLGHGIALARSRDYGKAQAVLDQLTALHPDFIDGLNARANLERLQGNWDAAESWYRRALAVQPGSAAVLANLGSCLKDAGRLEEARCTLARAAELAPADLDVRLNHATALVDCGRWDDAATQLRQILERQPEMPEAHASLGHILLARGEFSSGWEEYEWRYLCQDAKRQLSYPYPAWDGERLEGRTLVIRAEQGLGDQIMFASCIPDLRPRVSCCILECDPRLVQLFARAFPEVSVCRKRADNPELWAQAGNTPDAQLFLSSLPRLFRRNAGDFPAHRGYLRADPEKVRRWRARLDGIGPGMKVGVSWRGGAPQTRQTLRSIPLAGWLPILRTGQIRFVSLQYGHCEEEIAALRGATGLEIHHWPDAIADYDETAALVTALDLVVSVQTSVVHLAGALGKEAWVLVPAVPEWRYMASGVTMPWYPSVRLFRQDTVLDWAPLIAAVADELAARCP